jgi:Tfp pilus assembly protein PilO
MSGRTRLILAGVIALIVCLLFYVLMIRPRKSELSDLQAQVLQEEQKTTQLNLTLAHLRELQDHAPQAQAELARIKQFVPENNDFANFVFQVQAAADQAGVGVVQVTNELPKTPPEGAALSEIRVTIGAKGGYFAIQDFIRRLYDLKRAVRIDTANLSGETDEETHVTIEKLVITARIFFELPDTAAVPTGTTPVPATSPTPAPATTP